MLKKNTSFFYSTSIWFSYASYTKPASSANSAPKWGMTSRYDQGIRILGLINTIHHFVFGAQIPVENISENSSKSTNNDSINSNWSYASECHFAWSSVRAQTGGKSPLQNSIFSLDTPLSHNNTSVQGWGILRTSNEQRGLQFAFSQVFQPQQPTTHNQLNSHSFILVFSSSWPLLTFFVTELQSFSNTFHTIPLP